MEAGNQPTENVLDGIPPRCWERNTSGATVSGPYLRTSGSSGEVKNIPRPPSVAVRIWFTVENYSRSEVEIVRAMTLCSGIDPSLCINSGESRICCDGK